MTLTRANVANAHCDFGHEHHRVAKEQEDEELARLRGADLGQAHCCGNDEAYQSHGFQQACVAIASHDHHDAIQGAHDGLVVPIRVELPHDQRPEAPLYERRAARRLLAMRRLKLL